MLTQGPPQLLLQRHWGLLLLLQACRGTFQLFAVSIMLGFTSF